MFSRASGSVELKGLLHLCVVQLCKFKATVLLCVILCHICYTVGLLLFTLSVALFLDHIGNCKNRV